MSLAVDKYSIKCLHFSVSKKPPIIALYELRISVEPCGILIQHYKYPVVFTGKNYIGQMVTDKMHKEENYNYSLSHRVPAHQIMKLQRVSLQDTSSYVGRTVYHLEGQLSDGSKLVKDDITKTLERMRKQVEETHLAWASGKERPRSKVA